MDHTHVRRACCTAIDATAAEAFVFMLRNCLGTSNVPNLLCRAKTLWSCRARDAGVFAEFYCVPPTMPRMCVAQEQGSKMVRRDGQGGVGRVTDSSLLCLLGPLADRSLRHCHPYALLLSVGHVEKLAGWVPTMHGVQVGCATRAAVWQCGRPRPLTCSISFLTAVDRMTCS